MIGNLYLAATTKSKRIYLVVEQNKRGNFKCVILRGAEYNWQKYVYFDLGQLMSMTNLGKK